MDDYYRCIDRIGSLCSPFLIFPDYHKQGQIHLAVTYLIAFLQSFSRPACSFTITD